MREIEFAKQTLRGGDLVGLFRDIGVRQDQTGFGIERVQHLGCLSVAEIVEATLEGLPVERDGASRRIGCLAPQSGGVMAENLLDRRWVQALEDVADGGMGRRALPAQTEGRVQPTAMHRDERFDGPKGIAAGYHGEDREQQNVGQFIELSLGPARVWDFVEQAE